MPVSEQNPESAPQIRGVVPILAMPFDEQGRIDEESLRSLVDFEIELGVHGLGVALASEVFKLTEAERALATRTIVDQAKGRVPVVINTSAPGTDLAVHYSRMAADNGADALMLMPPSFMPAGADEVVDYFRAISHAVNIPIFIQDVAAAPVSAALAKRLAQECEQVRYIKVETVPVTVKVADVVAQAGDDLIVFGGAGGGYFIEEVRRGSVGTMPGSGHAEAFVAVWNHLQRGEEAAARTIFDHKIVPINRIAAQGMGIFYYVHKEILRRRSVIRSTYVRSPAPAIDELTRRELQQVIDDLYGT